MLGRAVRAALALVISLVSLLGIAPAIQAEPPANLNFLATWQRTDLPVVEGQATRTWMWGPEAFTSEMSEPYVESPGGQRIVQYFDKSRMEITTPDADPNSIWYVTNGLLVVELVTGQLQTGNDTFETRQPATVNVAGDGNDPNGPTYATFASILDQPPHAAGDAVVQRLNRAGELTDDDALAGQNVVVAIVDDVTNHAIAAPFWDFMTSSGTVYENGGFTIAPLFENAYFATGRPISEPAWADVLVGGNEKLVLVQCFERRCLTYTPDNAPKWRVEAGNVGQHYYAWRFGDGNGDPPPPPPTETLECQIVGFPCTLAETPEEVANRMYDLGVELVTMLSDGDSIGAVAQYAQSQPDVAEVQSDVTSIRFRVDGGPPAWVFDEIAEVAPTTSAIEIRENGQLRTVAPHRLHPDEVVGKDYDTDGMTDEEPKRGLFLSPFRWQFDYWDVSQELVAMLEEVRGYAGNVEYYENTFDESGEIQEQVTLDMFAGWNSYDVVYILTHGGGACKEIDDGSGLLTCWSGLSTGIRMTRETFRTMNVTGGAMSFSNVPGGDGNTLDFLPTLALTNDFFLTTYPTGLDNTYVHLSACKVFPHDYDSDIIARGDLPAQLAGETGVVVGWDDTTGVDAASSYAMDVFTMAINTGIPVGAVARDISLVHGPATFADKDGQTYTARLTSKTGGVDLRIREVVTQLDPLTLEPLEDGDAVPIIGQYGDGVNDYLPFVVEIDGVEDPSGFDVHIRVDGQDLPTTFSLATATPISELKYRLEADVALWFDAIENQPIELRIWTTLPEGGESKQTIDARLRNPVLDFHSVIETLGGGTVSIRSEVHAEFTLIYNDDFSGIEPGSTTLEYVSYDIDVAGTGCEAQATLHDGTIEYTNFDFPTGPDGRISSFVPNEVRLRIPPEISADVTLMCPQGPVDLPGPDIHWFAGWVVAHGGVGGSGGGVDEFDEAEGVWVIENWQDDPPRKVYDQTIPNGDVTLYETTRLEINVPED